MKQTFNIQGMSCKHCVAKVEEAAKSLNGVDKIKVNLKKNNGVVKFDESLTDAATIAAKISEVGYPTEAL